MRLKRQIRYHFMALIKRQNIFVIIFELMYCSSILACMQKQYLRRLLLFFIWIILTKGRFNSPLIIKTEQLLANLFVRRKSVKLNTVLFLRTLNKLLSFVYAQNHVFADTSANASAFAFSYWRFSCRGLYKYLF
jgi:hypothetical protein